jgi:phosphoribosylanthranilate isomerase
VGDREGLAGLIAGLPPFVGRVGVCLEPSQIPATVAGLLTDVQFYSDEWRSDAPEDRRLVRAVRVRDAESLDEIDLALRTSGRAVSGIHLDTYHKEKLGGTGETFNWDIAASARSRFSLPLILAGGLTPENVREAIARVRPFAVDVSGGVEAEPGRKDHARLREFIQAVRRADDA